MKILIGVLLMASVAWGAEITKIRVALVNTPQVAEQTRTLMNACPSIVITGDPDKADFGLHWDSKMWKDTSWGGHENEYTLYNPAGDVVGTGATHHMKNAARDICKLITSKK